ncbi:NAD-P-binding protein [Rhizodiscina lignyota]|uniref:NAD-P-binding protein n=1 Tax=Rhizodiscina lignyota TaxID=1504668 RepID=A0A9P4I9C7_9PEZI|nr:NAD-P-binding protein [Rhizodiscina lignyota]
MDVSLDLTDTHVLITGGAGLIGSSVVKAFQAAGARVSSLDIKYPREPRFVPSGLNAGSAGPGYVEHHVDITSEESVKTAFDFAADKLGPVSVCIALGALDFSVIEHHDSATTLSAEQFRRTLDVNVTGTFITAREWLRGLNNLPKTKKLKNPGLIIIGSESGVYGSKGNADYGTSKSAVQVGMLKSFAADAPRIWEGARVNAVAPGAVDTERFKEECREDPFQYYTDAQATVALCKPIPLERVAKTILFLASESFSGNIHGQLISVNSGKQGKLLYTEAEGRKRNPYLES